MFSTSNKRVPQIFRKDKNNFKTHE
jgi:hypothetical protein